MATASIPATFHDFLGNGHAVEGLRTAIAAGRLPHSLILAGPQGAGKYTLALMLAMALECERQPRELWSTGSRWQAIAACAATARVSRPARTSKRWWSGSRARETMRETDKKDTRVLVQTHPDVLIVPPDPPQLLIKLGQVRSLIQRAQYLPSEAPRKVFIITAATFMKEAANSLLKVLEEPPDYAHIILCAENVGELLPTIRSRCAIVRLGALAARGTGDAACGSARGVAAEASDAGRAAVAGCGRQSVGIQSGGVCRRAGGCAAAAAVGHCGGRPHGPVQDDGDVSRGRGWAGEDLGAAADVWGCCWRT